MGFFGQGPRLEFLGMLRGIFIFFIILVIIFFIILAFVWSIISWEAQRFEGNSQEFQAKSIKIDEKMKKKR